MIWPAACDRVISDDDDFKRAMCFESLNGTDVRLVWGDCTSALWPDSNLGTSAKRGQGLVGCDGVSVFEDIGACRAVNCRRCVHPAATLSL
jgi:hypothetical protein